VTSGNYSSRLIKRRLEKVLMKSSPVGNGVGSDAASSDEDGTVTESGWSSVGCSSVIRASMPVDAARGPTSNNVNACRS
jgi:hypothetical protein